MHGQVNTLSRRRILRGMMNGAAVTVALPFLDCFLNGNGNALASGAPMPVRFGTWLWGCGVATQIFKGQENDAFPYRGLRRAPASGPESEYGAAKAESDREAFQRTLGSIAMSA